MMSVSWPRYSRMLEAIARRRGLSVEFSPLERVSGGGCPPPSRIYPGQVCYMATVRVGSGGQRGEEFHGFGPNAVIARRAAAAKAYKALASVDHDSRGVDVCNGFEVESGSDAEEAGCDDEQLDCPSLVIEASSQERKLAEVVSRITQDLEEYCQCRSPLTQPLSLMVNPEHTSEGVDYQNAPLQQGVYKKLQNSSDTVESRIESLRQGLEDYCHIRANVSSSPYGSDRPESVDKPESLDEPVTCPEDPSEQDLWPPDLQNSPLVRAFNDRMEFFSSGSKPLSPPTTSDKIGATIYQVTTPSRRDPPSISQTPPLRNSPTASPKRSPPSGNAQKEESRAPSSPQDRDDTAVQTKGSKSNTQHSMSASRLCSMVDRRDPTQRPKDLPPPLSKEDTAPSQSDNSAVDTERCSSGSRHDSRGTARLYADNPIGQLCVLIDRELHTSPVFSEKLQSVDSFKKYICVVSAKGLSAEGVGSSKKLAKRHAAENILEMMAQQGMNTDPEHVHTKPKKGKEHHRAKFGLRPGHHRRRSSYDSALIARDRSSLPSPNARTHPIPPPVVFHQRRPSLPIEPPLMRKEQLFAPHPSHLPPVTNVMLPTPVHPVYPYPLPPMLYQGTPPAYPPMPPPASHLMRPGFSRQPVRPVHPPSPIGHPGSIANPVHPIPSHDPNPHQSIRHSHPASPSSAPSLPKPLLPSAFQKNRLLPDLVRVPMSSRGPVQGPSNPVPPPQPYGPPVSSAALPIRLPLSPGTSAPPPITPTLPPMALPPQPGLRNPTTPWRPGHRVSRSWSASALSSSGPGSSVPTLPVFQPYTGPLKHIYPDEPSVCPTDSEGEAEDFLQYSPGVCEVLPKELSENETTVRDRADSHDRSRSVSPTMPPLEIGDKVIEQIPQPTRRPDSNEDRHCDSSKATPTTPNGSSKVSYQYPATPPSDPLFFTVRLAKEKEKSPPTDKLREEALAKSVPSQPVPWLRRLPPSANLPKIHAVSQSVKDVGQQNFNRSLSNMSPSLPVHPLLTGGQSGHREYSVRGAGLPPILYPHRDVSVSLPTEGTVM